MLQALLDSQAETVSSFGRERGSADTTATTRGTEPSPTRMPVPHAMTPHGLPASSPAPAVRTGGGDPLIGQTVAHYDIVAKVGGGGMGVVYKARDQRLGRLVALKFLPPHWSHDETAKQRFIREAQAASATDHRSVCTIYDLDTTDDGQLFMVMAYYEGQTLKQKLDAGALSVREALAIAAQIAEGLARAHAQGIVHRDIKPGNLMLTADGVKILDFGIAKFRDSLQLTGPGSTFGTVAYMSPEQLRGEEVDGRSDLWALGVVLYQMLVGEVPFKGATVETISQAIWNEPPRLPRRPRPDLPPRVVKLVFKALSKDPQRRFQSAAELADRLRRLESLTAAVESRVDSMQPAVRVGPAETRAWRRLWDVLSLRPSRRLAI